MFKTIIIVTFLMNIGNGYADESNEQFPVPEILKQNVEFWKKIYTEVPMSCGVLHDRDYPLIIYKKLADVSSQRIKAEKEKILQCINNINTQPQSAWTEDEKRIFELFKQNADTSLLSDAADRLRFQLGQSDRFREGLERSGMYLDTIRAIFSQYGVPPRLAYLPHVESSFNTAAYSKVGAAGLWQFMRGTGKLFGMRIDYTIDERRDPIKASIAAARYLSDAYKELKSWPLAITSYNHGLYGMKRAVNATGSSDIGFIIKNYNSKSFKFASTNFYSCFLAASEIAENYKTYFPSVNLLPSAKFNDITLDHYISPDVLCKYLKIQRQSLITFNPAIRPVVFEQNKKLPQGFTIHIPADRKSEIIDLALAQIPDSLKANEPERPQYYRVNKGDNLYTIASRLGVPVKMLANENDITKYNKLRSGQILRVPAHQAQNAPLTVVETSTTSTALRSDSQQASNDAAIEMAQAEAQQTLPPEEIPPAEKNKDVATNTKEAVKPSKPAKPSPQEIKPDKVKEDLLTDSLKEIALAPAVDDKQYTPTERPTVTSNFDISLYNLDVTLSPVGTSAEITVSIDETIGHYADWLGIPTSKIRKLNDMGRNSDIRVNRHISIPIDNKDALEKFVSSRLEYHMAIEEDFYSQYKVSDVKPRTVKKGESLWDICNGGESPLPLWLFKKYNQQLDLSKLMPETTVWIPVIEDRTEEDLENDAPVKNPSRYSPFVQQIREVLKTVKRVP
jgi:membrane-bound lytic murein transglycosylase D